MAKPGLEFQRGFGFVWGCRGDPEIAGENGAKAEGLGPARFCQPGGGVEAGGFLDFAIEAMAQLKSQGPSIHKVVNGAEKAMPQVEIRHEAQVALAWLEQGQGLVKGHQQRLTKAGLKFQAEIAGLQAVDAAREFVGCLGCEAIGDADHIHEPEGQRRQPFFGRFSFGSWFSFRRWFAFRRWCHWGVLPS